MEAEQAIKEQPGTSPGQLVGTRAHESPLDIVGNCQREAKANNQSENNCSWEKSCFKLSVVERIVSSNF